MKIVLPIPPSVNKSKGGKNWKTGRFYSSPKLSAWQKKAAEILKGYKAQTYTQNVHIVYRFHPKNKTFGDTQNYLKAVTDALVSARVIEDDRHTIVVSEHAYFAGYDKENPRVEISIEGVA